MNPAFVADSSVAMAWVIPAQSSIAAGRLLDDVEAGVIFVVPRLWMLEVANGLLALRRRQRIGGHYSA